MCTEVNEAGYKNPQGQTCFSRKIGVILMYEPFFAKSILPLWVVRSEGYTDQRSQITSTYHPGTPTNFKFKKSQLIKPIH